MVLFVACNSGCGVGAATCPDHRQRRAKPTTRQAHDAPSPRRHARVRGGVAVINMGRLPYLAARIRGHLGGVQSPLGRLFVREFQRFNDALAGFHRFDRLTACAIDFLVRLRTAYTRPDARRALVTDPSAGARARAVHTNGRRTALAPRAPRPASSTDASNSVSSSFSRSSSKKSWEEAACPALAGANVPFVCQQGTLTRGVGPIARVRPDLLLGPVPHTDRPVVAAGDNKVAQTADEKGPNLAVMAVQFHDVFKLGALTQRPASHHGRKATGRHPAAPDAVPAPPGRARPCRRPST